MSGRVPKRIRAGSTAGKYARGDISQKGRQESPSKELNQSSYYSRTKTEPESGLLELSQSGRTRPDQSLGLPPPGKMLLPPLPKSRAENAASSRTEKNRTSHACDKCRKAKAKCSGGQPCEKCRTENKECMYGDGKRDKERKEMARLQHRNEKFIQRNDQLVNALLNFASELSANKRRELEGLVMSAGSGTDEDDDINTNFDSDTRGSDPMMGEEDADAEVGSARSLDVINEDTNRDEHTRAAGFMGKSSAVTWVQRAKKAATYDLEDERHVRRSTGTAANGSFTDSTYHAEPGDILTVQVEDVNPLEWPPPAVARALVDAYFNSVHVSFPILSRNDFYKKFETFPKDQISTEEQCWLSAANMVFAISAKFVHLTNAKFRGEDRDHLVYYARACALGLDQRTLSQDPELQHTACLGVLGLYLLATDQLNRSWTVCGIAVRHAVALGLHVRSEAKDLSDMDKELRVRLWWSLYSLERHLDELTGRPSCISDRDISTPLPINVDESDFRRDYPLYRKHHRQSATSPKIRGRARLSAAQIPTLINSSAASMDPSMVSTSPTGSPAYSAYTFSMTRLPITSSTYLIYRTQLSILSHEILTQLYCAALVKVKWIEVQDTIRDIDSKLLKWKASLPEEFDFSKPSQTDAFTLQRTSLSMFYNSSRMTLFRLCLCRFEGRIVNESERSKAFDTNSAAACIDSARNILALLPSMSEPAEVYTITAWWSVVHYIVEAGSVLMLELAYRAEHLPSQAEEILEDSKKAVLWLRAMSGQSIAARKGWEIFNSLLEKVAPKVGGETWNMPKAAPVPPGWRWNRFGTRSKRNSIEEHVGELSTQTQQPYAVDPNRTNNWVNQSTYSAQQAYSAPAPIASQDAFTTTNGIIPSFLVDLYPFNEIYGRHNEFGMLPPQNTYIPPEVIQNAYQNMSNYPSTEGGGGNMIDTPGVMAPQMVTMVQVQLGGEMGNSGEGNYNDPGAQDFAMAGYRGWNDAQSGAEG